MSEGYGKVGIHVALFGLPLRLLHTHALLFQANWILCQTQNLIMGGCYCKFKKSYVQAVGKLEEFLMDNPRQVSIRNFLNSPTVGPTKKTTNAVGEFDEFLMKCCPAHKKTFSYTTSNFCISDFLMMAECRKTVTFIFCL